MLLLGVGGGLCGGWVWFRRCFGFCRLVLLNVVLDWLFVCGLGCVV